MESINIENINWKEEPDCQIGNNPIITSYSDLSEK